MPCLNAGHFLQPAIESVLSQPGLLELLVADGGSTDGSLEQIEMLSDEQPRLRLVSTNDQGPGDALNRAFQQARGSLIGWLNADDLYTPNALPRAIEALQSHPFWLMVYGEGEEFDPDSLIQRSYSTIHPAAGLQGLRQSCGICQPTVLWRRSMGILLGPFITELRTAFDYDYWLRAFIAFPDRIGYIPQLQARTRLHPATITSRLRAQVALEATQLQATYFGSASSTHLHNYGLELQQGLAPLPAGSSITQQMASLIEQAQPWLQPHAQAWLKGKWCPSNEALLAEEEAAALRLEECPSVQLLQIAHPQLQLSAPSTPAGPHSRLLSGIARHASTSPLLLEDRVLQKHLPNLASHGSQTKPNESWQQKPFGVNLIGHASSALGVGENLRMAFLALQAAEIPISVINVPAEGAAPCQHQLEPWMHPGPCGPYAINLICLQPTTHAHWLCQHGLKPQSSCYSIADWPWETEQWPEIWQPLLQHIDELWPASQLIHKALAPQAQAYNRPIHTMPMAVQVPQPDQIATREQRLSTRQHHGLPGGTVLFVYAFDFNSTAIRKNPRAVVEAFQQAFPPDNPDPVGLVIKVLPQRHVHPDWLWLNARAQADSRITLLQANLSRVELLQLYGCCDVFISLHRSEGFGRSLAEALQLGLDVIATGYGGNVDFCQGPSAHLVPWQRAAIPAGAYPPAQNDHWANPDMDAATKLMRQAAEARFNGYQPSTSTLETYRQQFSAARVGRRYRQRLEAIWEQR